MSPGNSSTGVSVTTIANRDNDEVETHGISANRDNDKVETHGISCNRPSEVTFVGSNEANAHSEALNLLQSTTPISQFPLPPGLIWSKSRMIKAGTLCTVAWTFARQVTLNISLGKVTRVNNRNSENNGKIFVKYQGIHGHKAGDEFNVFLPPQPEVRIYKVLWH